MNQVRYYFKKYGFVKTVKKVVLKTYTKIFRREQEAHLVSEREKYQIWIKNNEPDEKQLEEQKNTAVIEEIKTRKTYIKRPKLANITKIIFVKQWLAEQKLQKRIIILEYNDM